MQRNSTSNVYNRQNWFKSIWGNSIIEFSIFAWLVVYSASFYLIIIWNPKGQSHMNGETRLNFLQIKENYTINLRVILPEDITNNHWILYIQAKLKKSTWDPLFQAFKTQSIMTTKQSGPIEKMIQRAKRTIRSFNLSPGYGLLSELNNYIKKSIFRICICATELREIAFNFQKINEFDAK